jgi:hypothetical protein
MTSDTEIRNQIAQRNYVRASSAILPELGHREFEKLKAARTERIVEAVFAVERARFSRNWTSKKNWFSGMAEYSRARATVREELRMGQHIEHVLYELGYRLTEDAWESHGRKTYLSDENADRQSLKDLQTTLAEYGWLKDEHRLRCFRCAANDEIIEIEPGGGEVSGHLLHYLKSE